MEHLLKTLRPVAPAQIHLLLAALMWSVVGATLAGFGLKWLWASPVEPHAPLMALAIVLGVLKGHFALEKAARRMVARIEARGDGHWIGGFISPGSWLMIAAMAGGGRALRAWVLPLGWSGLLYILVGSALLLASRVLWAGLSARRRAER